MLLVLQECPEIHSGKAAREMTNERKHDATFAREFDICFICMRDAGHQLFWNKANLIHKSSNSFELYE